MNPSPDTPVSSGSLSASSNTLLHVLRSVLNQPVNGELHQALERDGFTDIHDICTIRDEDIDKLKYLKTDGDKIPLLEDLSSSKRNLIRVFRDFIAYWRREHLEKGKKINFYKFASLDFDDFHVGIYTDTKYNPQATSTGYTKRSDAEEW